ncbi:Protein of unknown function DUF229 [Carpediemonas membranifera]|uniref:Uncharacterized protein n=1 Tax=Carpediemonas membranifera TaxID=201153 RepID=A0A8J6AWK3_9EUKA|nr:Protein of unknown function DUF229 [Carpediemonas membranifera]|eukprot:KAG9393390.1 Protein of unknown function DUF229 [Carpediemonas membranifera]
MAKGLGLDEFSTRPVVTLRVGFASCVGMILLTSLVTSFCLWLIDFSVYNAGEDSELFPSLKSDATDLFFTRHPYSVLMRRFPESTLPASSEGASLIVSSLELIPTMHQCSGEQLVRTASNFILPNSGLALKYSTDWLNPTYSDLVEPVATNTGFMHVKRTGILNNDLFSTEAPLVFNTMPEPPLPLPADEGPPASAPHVVVIIIDAVSRANMARTMPLVMRRLRSWSNTADVRAVSYPFFHTIGLNTPPNETPLFSGRYQPHKYQTGRRFFPEDYLDTPWIWQRAKEQGYVTARASQWCREFMSCSLGLSNVQEHFDYHYTGGACHAESSEGYSDITGRDNVCNNGRSDASVMADWVRGVVSASDKVGRKSFSFVLIEQAHNGNGLQFSNNVQDAVLSLMDLAVDNNTAVVLLGDHGLHYSDFSSTAYGVVEVRQPPLSIILPSSVLANRPQDVVAMTANTAAVVSPLDVHATLLDIAGISAPATEFDGGVSVMSKSMDTNRTCADAGIPEVWCLFAGPTKTLKVHDDDDTSEASTVIDMALAELNSVSDEHDVCKHVTLSSVDFAMVRTARSDGAKHYEVMFDAAPFHTRWSARATQSAGGLWGPVELTHISPYRRFETCRPAEVDKGMCVCYYAPWAFVGWG